MSLNMYFFYFMNWLAVSDHIGRDCASAMYVIGFKHHGQFHRLIHIVNI